MAPYSEVKPFTISVPDDQLDHLRKKLDLTRLPDELDLPIGQQWDWGIPLAVLKPVVDYWRTQYDWRAVEERINQTLPQFTTYVESVKHGEQEVHFVHKRSENPNAVPLIFVHGWPGYKYYAAQGGDWGSLVVQALAVHHQDTCLAVHANLNFVRSPTLLKNPIMTLKTALGLAGLPGGYPKDEIDGIAKAQEFLTSGAGYQKIQGTRPQTLAVGLTDSPVGLLAWIAEKLHVWTDSYPWTPEEIITWTMLYWIRGPAGGLRYYKENSITGPPKDPELRAELETLRSSWTPTLFGYSWFPKEIASFPVEWAGIGQQLVYSKKHKKGGHFAAWEVPELLANDIQNFVTIVLEKEPRLLNVE
ncbi:unnamed protein product [Rhizoctonia solani]|uniref:Epoxide hydrolase N-terminal domain-containing protein n=1 Tax=Rhizoctonia solani TaxID=456999 RepID=A0A8H2X530_9AGAM|nr:unnamed protein product [Rhizoctonia solani]